MSASRASSSALKPLLQAVRNMVKEPHPIGRYPTTSTIYRPDYTNYFRQIGRTAGLFIPMASAVLGWPWAVRHFGKPGGFVFTY